VRDTVYVGSNDGNLYAVSAKDGEEIWKYNTQGRVLSTPLVTGNKIYFGSGDSRIRAIETEPVGEGEYVEYMQKQRNRTVKEKPETEEEILDEYYEDTEIIG